MNYQKVYDQIIERSKLEKRHKGCDKYYEAHHIVPRCLGGDGNVKQWKFHSNIVLLTAREHFICHWLLHLIYPDNKKLSMAFCSMCFLKNDQQSRYTPSSRVIEASKLRMSELKRGNKGYWKGKHLHDSTKQRISKTKTGVSIHSEEFKKQVGMRSEGNQYMLNKSHTKSTKELMSESHRRRYKSNPDLITNISKVMKNRKQKQVECPHCRKLGGNTMGRWHFENCKFNPNHG